MMRYFSLLFVALFFYSCDQKTVSEVGLIPGIVGQVGEVMVVLPENEWVSERGNALRDLLLTPYRRLPQEEPSFDVLFQTPDKFDKYYSRYRNIILVDIRDHIDYRDHGQVKLIRDKHALGQVIVQIGAKNEADFLQILEEMGDRILEIFSNEEISRLQNNLSAFKSFALSDSIIKYVGVDMDMTKGYYTAECEEGFVWLRKADSQKNPELAQWYFVYKTPYQSESDFSIDSQIVRRDSVLRQHVIGGGGQDVMQCETRLHTFLDTITHNGSFAVMLRGLWKIDAAFMGGPYVSVSFLDQSHQYMITVEGNVYAPHDKKRKYLRAMEAIVMTAHD